MFLESLPCPDLVAIAGSLPPGLTPEIYRKIIAGVMKCRAKVFLDVDGEAL